jgi:hypothetical protein
MNVLVRKLAEGSHPVELILRPEKTQKTLKECLERGYVFVKFTRTLGGTELGVRIDENTAQLALASVDRGETAIHVSGNLSLDYVQVRCVADINLDTCEGTGYLEVLQ